MTPATYALPMPCFGRKRCSAPTVACHVGLLPLGEVRRGFSPHVDPHGLAACLRVHDDLLDACRPEARVEYHPLSGVLTHEDAALGVLRRVARMDAVA